MGATAMNKYGDIVLNARHVRAVSLPAAAMRGNFK